MQTSSPWGTPLPGGGGGAQELRIFRGAGREHVQKIGYGQNGKAWYMRMHAKCETNWQGGFSGTVYTKCEKEFQNETPIEGHTIFIGTAGSVAKFEGTRFELKEAALFLDQHA